MNVNYVYNRMTPYVINNKQYVIVSVTSHRDRNKVVVHLEVFDGYKYSSITRIGKLFNVDELPNKVLAEMLIDNTRYAVDIATGRIEGEVTDKTFLKWGYQENPQNSLNGTNEVDLKLQTLRKLKDECDQYLRTGKDTRCWTQDIDLQIDHMQDILLSLDKSQLPFSVTELEMYRVKLKKHKEYIETRMAQDVKARQQAKPKSSLEKLFNIGKN